MGPPFGEPKWAAFRHFDKSKRLLAGDQECPVPRSLDLEVTPEPSRRGLAKPPVNFQLISQDCRASVINFRPNDDGVDGRPSHVRPVHPELDGEESPCRLNEAEVGDIVNHSPRIGVKEHYLYRGDDGGGRHCRIKLKREREKIRGEDQKVFSES